MQKVFSPSSLNCFENCPRQYAFRYIEKIKIETEGIEAFVGKRVHEILERLFQFVGQRLLPSLPKVIARYQANFDAQYDAARVRITREGTPADFYRAAGVRGIENFYRRHYPFDRDQTIGLEKPIQFTLDADGKYAVRGIIDRIARAKDGVLEIQDFKTARRIPRQDDLDRDRQLGLYELGIARAARRDGRRAPGVALRAARRAAQLAAHARAARAAAREHGARDRQDPQCAGVPAEAERPVRLVRVQRSLPGDQPRPRRRARSARRRGRGARSPILVAVSAPRAPRKFALSPVLRGAPR